MRRTARERGIRIDHRALQLQRRDLDEYDLVVAMDRSNRANIQRLAGDDPARLGKIRLLREFEPDGAQESDVPDPYYGGERGFHEVIDIAERCCQRLYEKVRDGDVGPV